MDPSSINASRKRPLLNEEGKSRKCPWITRAPNSRQDQHDRQLDRASEALEPLDEATDVALEYLLAIPKSHRVVERNLKRVLDWVGCDARSLTATNDRVRDIITRMCNKVEGLGHRKCEDIIDRLLNEWTSKVLRQLAACLDEHVGVADYQKFIALPGSENYRIELKITPVHEIADEEQTQVEEPREGKRTGDDGNGVENTTYDEDGDGDDEGDDEEGEENVAEDDEERMSEIPKDGREDEDISDSGIAMEDHSSPATPENAVKAQGRTEDSHPNFTGVQVASEKPPSQIHRNETFQPPSLSRAPSVCSFQKVLYPDEVLLFKMPNFSCSRFRNRRWVSQPGP